ncbi:MAG: SPASM domain-containing protein [Oscillospiraceae bacterium]
MNASEVLKGFAMKQVYSYLDKDPEANLPNLLDMLEKYDKNGQAVTTQVEGIRAALSDPNNNWSKLVKSLWTDIDDEQRKKLVETVVINGTLIDDAFADEMLRVKNLVPAISIEGFEEATDFRRGEGTYRKVIEAMTRLKERKLLFGISCCYTSKNVEVIGSEEYFDSMIDMGAKFAWFFTYMPIGAAAVPELIATAEQRKFMYEQIHKFRKTKPLFTMDFWNDGDAVGGCIAGGRGYCHINANGDMEPCAFIHYSDSNIKEKTLLECYQSPLFMAYRRSQPFNDNMLRPCSVLDNPGRLTQIVEESGARSTDLESPERACDYCNRCVPAAEKWAPVADELWNSLPKKKGVQLTGKMAKKS